MDSLPGSTKTSIWLRPQENRNMSSSDEFLLKPTRENKVKRNLHASKWRWSNVVVGGLLG